jgi:hypothetical protein
MYSIRGRAGLRIALPIVPLFIAALWVWSYHSPAGVGRVSRDIRIAASDHGSILIVRRDGSPHMLAGALHAGYEVFAGNCPLADESSIALARFGHSFLGFAFAVDRSPRSGDTFWVLDESGTARSVDYSTLGLSSPRPPARQWAIAVPWWSVFALTSGICFWVWRRTKPRYSAFPIAVGTSHGG